MPWGFMVAVNLGLSVIAYLLTLRMALAMGPRFVEKKLFGIDLNKKETKREADGTLIRPVEGPIVPEAMGVVAGTAYLAVMFVFIPFATLEGAGPWGAPGASMRLSKLLCALLAICCMCFLGFADNVLDLRWRDKLWLPLTASLPLLMVYAVDGGGTTISVPRLFSQLLGGSVDIGVAYYAYMALLAIFCTNAINILAGVNGLEVGQAVVVAATVVVNNCIQLWRWREGSLRDNNLFSLCLMLPFLTVSCALLKLNWHPAKIFVGDTYCYFAGMLFAVAGILGHNAKTLLLFFVPQILNFIYSIPQLFKLVPCPRHRMPGYDPATDKLVMSYAQFDEAELGRGGRAVVALLTFLRIGKIERAGSNVKMSNLTLINYALFLLGPTHEARLTTLLLAFQAVCSVLGLLVRYQLASLLYDVVR